jgi:hypothetical protein
MVEELYLEPHHPEIGSYQIYTIIVHNYKGTIEYVQKRTVRHSKDQKMTITEQKLN